MPFGPTWFYSNICFSKKGFPLITSRQRHLGPCQECGNETDTTKRLYR